MKFETKMTHESLLNLQPMKGKTFSFLGGKDIQDLGVLFDVDIAAEGYAVQISSDYDAPGLENKATKYLEVSFFEVKPRSDSKVNKLLKKGWLFAKYAGLEIVDIHIVRTSYIEIHSGYDSFAEITETKTYEFVATTNFTYDLVCEQGIIFELSSGCVYLFFDHPEFFDFEAKYFDSLSEVKIFDSRTKVSLKPEKTSFEYELIPVDVLLKRN